MRRRYPPEFRRKVLDLLKAGRTVAELVRDLQISDQTIYDWRRQERIDTGQMPLRFVDGRPVSHVSTAYLQWLCERLASEGKRVLVLIWDNLNHHVSATMRQFVDDHDWLTVVQLPTYAPELNPTEGVWLHLKRGIGNLAPATRVGTDPGLAMQGGGMPYFGDLLTQDQIKAVVAYERGL